MTRILRLLAQCFWPPLYRSRIPQALIVVGIVALIFLYGRPSHQTILQNHLGVPDLTIYKKTGSKHVQVSPFEYIDCIYLQGDSLQIQELIQTQGFEEGPARLLAPLESSFPVGPELPTGSNARYFRRKNPQPNHDLIVTDQDLTQIWMKSINL